MLRRIVTSNMESLNLNKNVKPFVECLKLLNADMNILTTTKHFQVLIDFRGIDVTPNSFVKNL